ncbi:MAG: ExbD/TolR family protein [Phycisphaerae bacterium]
MARGKKNSTLGAGVEINMTPMIDCTFLLIVFFILTSQIIKAELVDMVVPDVTRAQVPSEQKPEDDNAIIIQAVSKAAAGDRTDSTAAEDLHRERGYRVGTQDFEPGDYTGIEQAIQLAMEEARAAGFKTFKVIVRADARLKYQYVYRLMERASVAGGKVPGIEMKMEIVSLRPE